MDGRSVAELYGKISQADPASSVELNRNDLTSHNGEDWLVLIRRNGMLRIGWAWLVVAK